MIVRNDCNQEEGPLTFELNGKCYNVVELMASCDNTEVLELLNLLVDKQDKCCKTRTIIKEVPVEIVKYIEYQTTKYVKYKDGPKPKCKTVRKKPTTVKPQQLKDKLPWKEVKGVNGWWYRTVNLENIYTDDKENVITEKQFIKLFPDLKLPKNGHQRIRSLGPKPQSTYKDPVGTYGGFRSPVPNIFR